MYDKVAIIISVYNTPIEFLSQCLNSCINQTYSNIEIIVINDGSLEKIQNFLDEFRTKDPRIRVFNKKNGGVSSCRNFGLKNVSRDVTYIYFLDSDDYIQKNTLELMINVAKDDCFDLIQFNYNIDNNGIIKNTEQISNEIVDVSKNKSILYNLIAINYSKKYYNKFYGMCIKTVWNKLFRYEIIQKNNIEFINDMSYGEDCIFMFDFLNKSKLICFKNIYTYFYRNNSLSLTNKYNDKIVENNIKLIEKYNNKYNSSCWQFNTCINRQILSFFVQTLKKYLCKKECPLNQKEKIELLDKIYLFCIKFNSFKYYDNNFFNFKEKILKSLILKKKYKTLLFLGHLM